MKPSSRVGLLGALMTAPCLLLLWPTLAYKGPAALQRETVAPVPPEVRPPPPPAPGGTRGPAALLFRPDGKMLYVTEQDENQVALLEPDSGQVVAHIPTGGEQPTGLAQTTDGKTLVVSNQFSGSVGILDIEKRAVRKTVPLRGMPRGVAVTPSGQALVCVSQLDEIAVLDLASGRIKTRIPVGRHPHTILLSADGSQAFCSGMGGSLSVLDVTKRTETTRIPLPAINLRGLALLPDGERLLITGQQPHNDKRTDNPEEMWSNVLCTVRLEKNSGVVERVLDLDQPKWGAADPWDVVSDPTGEHAWLTLAGTHEVMQVPATTAAPGEIRERKSVRLPVGANPRALAVRPHTSELWVANHLGSTLQVIPLQTDAASSAAGRVISLGPASPSPNRRLRGRFLFASAHLTRGRHFTCETCHPDGNSDGLTWKFAHVKDGLEERTTRDLRGNLLLTAPYGWGGRVEDFEDFVEEEIGGLLRTRKLVHDDVHAIWDLVNETALPPNPYRNADGTFTDAALRGKALFFGVGQCQKCHNGDQHGGTNKRKGVGTTPEKIKLDVPHLEGVYDGAPYLHDNRAATLEEVFLKHNTAKQHGKAHLLNPEQMHDLIQYLREL